MPVLCLAAIALFVIFTRWDSYSSDANVWDEATFAIVAHQWVEGYLPYLTAFDNKPPVIFGLVAAAEWIFGRSLVSIRVVADVAIVIGAALVLIFLKPRAGLPAAMAGATVFAAFNALSFARQLQSELPAVAFLLGSLVVLLDFRTSRIAALIAGALLGLAVLTRTNLVLAAPAMVAGLLLLMFVRRSASELARAIAFSIGFAIPFAILVLIYWHAGHLDILTLAVIDVPRAYATGQDSPYWVLRQHYREFRGFVNLEPVAALALALATGFAAFAAVRQFASLVRASARRFPEEAVVISFAGVATLASLLAGGAAYNHYWIQLSPFIALLIGWAFGAARAANGIPFRALLASIVVLVLAVLVPHSGPSLSVLANWHETVERYPARRAAQCIDAQRLAGDVVWAPVNHLTLYYLGDPPPSKAATHPDNLFRQPIITTLVRAGYIPDGEYERLLTERPAYLVLDDRPAPEYVPDAQAFARWKDENYRPIFRDEGVSVYVRADRPAIACDI